MIIEKFKKKKLLWTMLLTTIISFILGCLFISILNVSNQTLIKDSINEYFNGIVDGNFNYIKGLYSVLSSNLLLVLFIWVLGISIIGFLLVYLILIYKSFILGFSFTSIIYTYKFKGILLAIIYILPELINIFTIFLNIYYSISFSILLFNYLFRHKEFNKICVVRRYLKLLIISIVGVILSSILSIFIIPNLLRIL